MSAIETADFTPGRVRMQVLRGSYTPIVATFTELNLTGYTDPTFEYTPVGAASASTLTVTLVPGVNSAFHLTLDSAAWAALAAVKLATFKLSAKTPGGEPMDVLSGTLSIEDE